MLYSDYRYFRTNKKGIPMIDAQNTVFQNSVDNYIHVPECYRNPYLSYKNYLIGSTSFGVAQNTINDFQNTVLNSQLQCFRQMPRKSNYIKYRENETSLEKNAFETFSFSKNQRFVEFGRGVPTGTLHAAIIELCLAQ